MRSAKTAFLIATMLFSLAQAQRITVQGNKFFVGDNPIFMLGANTPWDNWNDFGHSFDYNWWSTHFQAMHNSGLNCTRVWISCNGDNSSPAIDATGRVSEPTSQFWTHVESLFEIAESNQIYLMIALISFDHSKTGNTNVDRWRLMYNNAENRQSFVDNYAIPFVERFGDNPYFWAIDVGNELDWVFEEHGIERNNVFDLAARVANGVHANSEVLVTLGTGAGPKYLSPSYGTNYYSDAELQKLQPGAYLDFYNDHYYDWMKQYFSTPFDNGPEDWQIDEKPCVIGEYAALGHGTGYSPAECLQKAYDLGWQGVMPWTSNGVDVNGSISNFGSAFQTWATAHQDLVFPPVTENPGPFTLTVTQSQGGSITVSPQKTQYERGESVTLTAVPDEGNELLRWTGDASGTTETVSISFTRNLTVSAVFATAGELIRNGSFDDGVTPWVFSPYEGAAASSNVVDGQLQASITNGGTDTWHVQLTQGGITLESGRTYVLSFSAAAASDRSIFVAVGESGGTYDKYCQQNVDLTGTMQNFSYEFTAPTSTNSVRVEFNMGNSTAGVTLDNISLKYADASGIEMHPGSKLKKVNDFACAINGNSLQIRTSHAGHLSVKGYSPAGSRIFAWEGRTAGGSVSIPLKENAPGMMILRSAIDNRHLNTKVLINK